MVRARTSRALAAAIALSWAWVCQAADTGLGKAIEDILAEEGLTGIAWTLIRDSGEVTRGSAGIRNNGARSVFTVDTRFHVGSLTKSVLATGILRLATEGRVDLDAPVLRYLPDLFQGEPPAGFSEVTVRHLLDHTAGLNDAHMWQMFSERADPDAPLAAAFPDPEAQLRVRSRPGSQFSYSNTGYTLLGMVIESIVGDRYEIAMDETVLAPLGMLSSTFAFTTQEGDDADPTLAWGHVDDGSRYPAAPMFLRPAGQFTTTAADLARYAAFLLGDGTIGGETYIDPSLMRSRGQPSGTDAAASGLPAGYALGMGRRDRHGVVGYCHGGNIVGFAAMLCVFPDEHKAFAYSVNTDSETANYGRLDALFIEALNVADAARPETVSPALGTREWQGRYVLSPNRFQAFEYLDTVFGSIKVAADGDSLTLTSLQARTRQLRPVGERLYSASDRETASHVLLRGTDGDYLISDGFQTYRKVSSTYLAAHWTSAALGFAGIAWMFVAGGVSLIRYRPGFSRRTIAPAFASLSFLFVPMPFFFAQSFMALGDITIASALLALATLLLPVGMLLTAVLASKSLGRSRVESVHGIAAVCVLQWCTVLFVNGMLPFRLWA